MNHTSLPRHEKRPVAPATDPMAMLRATNQRLNRRNQELEHIIATDGAWHPGFMAGAAASEKRQAEAGDRRLADYKHGTRLEMARLRGNAQVRETGDPEELGRYLVLCYEWDGLPDAKPDQPTWVIKEWKYRRNTEPGNEKWIYYWEPMRRQHDTGGYETLEVVCWMHLPPVAQKS